MLKILQTDRHLPMHLRRKIKAAKPKMKTFEMIPAHGFLLPGQRQNVQVKFMPTEEVCNETVQGRSIFYYDHVNVVQYKTMQYN